MAADDDGHLKLEIDGPGVKPETLDPLVTLELARAYFRLLRRVAEEREVSLELTGLAIEDKSVAVLVGRERLPVARLSSKSELRTFTVKVKDVPIVQRVATFLYKLIDVDVAVERDADGLIVRGDLLEFTAVDERKGLEEWRSWFAASVWLIPRNRWTLRGCRLAF